MSYELDTLLDLCVSAYDVLAREATAEVLSRWDILLVARLIKSIKMDEGKNVVLAYTDKQEDVLAMQTNIRGTLICLQDSGAVVNSYVLLLDSQIRLSCINTGRFTFIATQIDDCLTKTNWSAPYLQEKSYCITWTYLPFWLSRPTEANLSVGFFIYLCMLWFQTIEVGSLWYQAFLCLCTNISIAVGTVGLL